MCDFNGCFPGQSRGYKSPNRPDVSWAEMQAEKDKMEAIKAEAKFNTKGPGCWCALHARRRPKRAPSSLPGTSPSRARWLTVNLRAPALRRSRKWQDNLGSPP